MKIKNKLMITYAATTILIVLSLAALFNMAITNVYRNYAENLHEKLVAITINKVQKAYDVDSHRFKEEAIKKLGISSLRRGLLVRVESTDGNFVWDIRDTKWEECQAILESKKNQMAIAYSNFKGNYTQNIYDITNGDQVVGRLTIGYYGPYSLSFDEANIIHDLNHTILILGISYLLLAIILAFAMARRISRPITSVVLVAKSIAEGEFGVQANLDTNTKEIQELVGTINDMSYALLKEENVKKQICIDIAHELRTPLCNLQGQMEAIIDGLWEPTPQRLRNCHSEIIRLGSLVNQLQELYALENSCETFVKKEFNFYELCERLCKEFESRCMEKKVSIILEVNQEDSIVYGDVQKLKQCMINLVSNAIAYSQIGGKVIISYQKWKDKRIVIQVKDFGKGIPEQDINYIFERFYRVDKSRNSNTGGMGIGLSITKAIIEKHNGNIYVESELGKGTTFRIYLPGMKEDDRNT